MNSSRKWYKGDFHLHTTSSDALYSPKELVELSRKGGLDFIAITDHNSIGAFSELNDTSDILVIPGIEVTSTDGHWNVFGFNGWEEWMDAFVSRGITFKPGDEFPAINYLLEHIHSRGYLNSINHPLLKPWEWQESMTNLTYVDCLEIWNDPLWPDNDLANPQSIELWTRWLKQGLRITAIGGSDFHFLPGEVEGYPGEKPGLPLTYVHTEQFSTEGILIALLHHRAYVSISPQIFFTAYFNDCQYEIGDTIPSLGGEIVFTFSVLGQQKGVKACLLNNGKFLDCVEESANGEWHQLNFICAPHTWCWFRLEVFDSRGKYLAITNPIYYGNPPCPEKTLYGDYVVDNVLIDG